MFSDSNDNGNNCYDNEDDIDYVGNSDNKFDLFYFGRVWVSTD